MPIMSKQKTAVECASVEISIYAAPQLLTDDYVLIASSDHDEGIFKYHLSKNKYSLIWKYPLNFDPLRHNILIDRNAATIYIYTATSSACDAFCEIDMRNGKNVNMYRGTVHKLLCIHSPIYT